MYFKLFMVILFVGIMGNSCGQKTSQNVKQSEQNVKRIEQEQNVKQTVQKLSQKVEAEDIEWVYSLSNGIGLAQEVNKPLMVDFYADWCGWCKKLDKDTYSDPKIIKLSNNFVCVKVNTDRNPQDSRKYKVRGLPTIVFLKSNGEIIEKVVGFRGPDDFTNIMSQIIDKL